jgi:hypothetical protein
VVSAAASTLVYGKRNLGISYGFSCISASFYKAFMTYRSQMNMRFLNRRRFSRRAVNEAAWIEKVPTILERCTLVDVSESGARLTISDVYDLPESFALHLTRESDAGRRCQIIWRRDHEVGVDFESESPHKQNTFRSHPPNDLRPWRSRMLMSAVTEA